jgi:sugar transferase (PEP-CTERM/EpsH1 system associated)
MNGSAYRPRDPAKPDLLFLTQRIPYPPMKGEKIRPLQILKHLGKTHNVHLGCLIDDPRDWEYVDTVKALCCDGYFARLNRKYDPLAYLRGFLTGTSLSVAVYRHAGLAHWVKTVLDRVKPDVIFVCSSNIAPYVLDHPHKGRVRLVDLADVDSEKWRAYADAAAGPRKWVFRREARLVAQLERRVAFETDFSTFVSEAEAALFRKMIPGRAAAIVGVSSGVDFTYFNPDADYPRPYAAGHPTYVFTGTMDYPPNVDAVTWFAEDILPIVRKTLPNAQFYIVGSSPSPAVLSLDELDGVFVTGRVPDVRPYLAYATAGVAPMRIARGIQNKVLEAMAMGKAVIVTPGALEGIEATPGEELILVKDTESFAAAAIRLHSGDEAARLGGAARRRMVDFYSWDHQLGRFDELLSKNTQ